jgi:hypothetical protein
LLSNVIVCPVGLASGKVKAQSVRHVPSLRKFNKASWFLNVESSISWSPKKFPKIII